MAVKIGHASIDERGKARGGAAGDQTGKEVCLRDWYDKNWVSVLRPKNEKEAEKMAKAMEQACANDHIGYDQSQRTTCFVEAKKVGFDLSKIKTKCETDCSALIAVCANAAGIPVSKDIYTGNEDSALVRTKKFEKLTDKKYLTSDKYLKRGDVLRSNGHTAIVLSDGSEVKKTTAGSKKNTASDKAKKTVAELAKEVIDGKWGNEPTRSKRLKAAGYDAKAVQKKVNSLLK